jgi:hypothetical protein
MALLQTVCTFLKVAVVDTAARRLPKSASDRLGRRRGAGRRRRTGSLEVNARYYGAQDASTAPLTAPL